MVIIIYFSLCNFLPCPHFLCGSYSDGRQETKDNPAKRQATDINYDMPPPPSPASSTCSEQSGPILVSPGSATASECTYCYDSQ